MEPVPSLTPPRRPSAAATSTLRVAAALYTLFVAYGCLVPLDFTPVPWAEAMRRFHPIAAFHPEHFSRTDFTANTLLFMPLAFVWAGAAGAGWKRAGALAAAVVVWIGAVLFQTALEFSQIYTPPRNVSLWDVIAAGLGAAIGVAAWLVAGGRVRAALDRWGAVRGRAGVAGWLAAPYAVFLVLYNVLPLDLTLDPSALHAKWTRGLIRPIPFTGMGGDIVSAALGLGTEAMLWLPLALFLVLSGRASRFVAWCATVFGAMAIEGVQLLVQSRVSDTTDILCAAAGAGVGVWLGGRWRGTAEVAEAGAEAVGGASARTVWGALVFATAWSGVLLGGFCYPFNFEYEPRAVARGIESLLSIPFRTYWLATEARAVTDLLRQVILFAPLGAAVAVAGAAWRGSGRGVWSMRTGAILAALGGALVGAMIEALQVFLPGKVPDSTDIVMAGIGGVAGFFGTRALGRALFPAEREAAGHADAPHAPHARTRRTPTRRTPTAAWGTAGVSCGGSPRAMARFSRWGRSPSGRPASPTTCASSSEREARGR